MIWFLLNIFSNLVRWFRGRDRAPAIKNEAAERRFAPPVGRPKRSPKKSLVGPPSDYFTDQDFSRGKRRESFVRVEGAGKSIAVLTSGGDAQGKNLRFCIGSVCSLSLSLSLASGCFHRILASRDIGSQNIL